MTTHLGKHCDSIILTGTNAIPSHDMAVDALNVFLRLETEEAQVILHEVYSIVKKLLEFCKHLFHLRNGKEWREGDREGGRQGGREKGRRKGKVEKGREKKGERKSRDGRWRVLNSTGRGYLSNNHTLYDFTLQGFIQRRGGGWNSPPPQKSLN